MRTVHIVSVYAEGVDAVDAGPVLHLVPDTAEFNAWLDEQGPVYGHWTGMIRVFLGDVPAGTSTWPLQVDDATEAELAKDKAEANPTSEAVTAVAELEEYACWNRKRDLLVHRAWRAGVSKHKISVITGHSRMTVDKILADPMEEWEEQLLAD